MKVILNSLLCIFLITTSPSCFDCREYVPPIFRFGTYYADVVSSDSISIGDVIKFSVILPKYFYDSISGNQIEIDRNIKISNKLDEHVPVSPSDDFFSIPETIFKTFDQYFELRVIKGLSLNAYTFECIEENRNWTLELEYKPKRTGMYYFSIYIMEINTSKADLPTGVCATGSPVYEATIHFRGDNNQMNALFQPQPGLEEQYYGFIVK
jgi:hypothetical protein